MKIVIDDIPADGLHLELSEEGGVFEAMAGELDFSFEGPVRAVLDVTTTEGNVLVRGHMKAALGLVCSRCIRDFTREIDTDFHLFFVRGRASARDVELTGADMDVNYLDAPELDTTEVLLSQLAIEAPMQPLCDAGCKGLCPRCGADLNKGGCACPSEESVDSRFAVLKDFKAGKGG
ncbi:MAG: DUF177 domain-containing protein [Thermodesulfobacteriota bacterium]